MHSRRTLIAAVAFVVLGMVFMGCAHTVTIKTNPPGAKVYVNGDLLGVSPQTYTTKGKKEFEVRVEKQGYQPVEATEKWDKKTGEEREYELSRK